MIKHIVFDFDGTIADDKELGLHIINVLAQRHNYPQLTHEEFNKLSTIPLKDRFKVLGVPFYKVPQLSLECLTVFRHLISNIKAFNGMHDLLANLSQEEVTLSIISSNSLENINTFLLNNDLEFFDQIISVKNLFGKHVSIKKYLKQFKLKAHEIIYIGDELRDIEACKRLGVKIIAVSWGFDPVTLLERGNPDYIAHKPEEIMAMVRKIKSN